MRLRGHHLLCLLTWSGEGYSQAFVDNFHRVVARIAAGEPVQLVEGPDDVCAPVSSAQGSHCGTASVAARDQRAVADIARLLGQPLAPGSTIDLDHARIAAMGDAFARGQIRGACGGCEWYALCSRIAAARFA